MSGPTPLMCGCCKGGCACSEHHPQRRRELCGWHKPALRPDMGEWATAKARAAMRAAPGLEEREREAALRLRQHDDPRRP